MFRRSGHTDDRRRRVLTEEVVGGAAGRSSSAARSPSPSDPALQPYAEAAKLENHRRVSELVPRRLAIVALLTVLAGGAIGGLVALHHRSVGATVENTTAITAAAATALDLRQHGSIASWLSAMLLMGAAAASLLVYSLRRHKQSDYHGRYRIWLWTALTAMGMSLCAAAPVHWMLAEQIAARSGWQLPSGLLLHWLIPLGLVLAVVGLRLLLDVRGSRLVLTVMLLAVAGHVAGLVVLHTGRPALPAGVAVMVGAGSQLAANLLLLVGITLFARHVLLDIEGRLPRPKEPAAKPAAAPTTKKIAADDLSSSGTVTSKGTMQRKIEASHASPPAPAAKSDTAKSDTAAELAASRRRREEADEEQSWYESNRSRRDQRHGGQDDDDDDSSQDGDDGDGTGHRKLSKAERKRLRRLKAQQRESEFN